MAGRAPIELPGDETEVDLVSRTMTLLSVEGVARTVMRRRPGMGLVFRLEAVHCLGWFEIRWKPRRASWHMVVQAGLNSQSSRRNGGKYDAASFAELRSDAKTRNKA
jgi:hypothetical protein